MSMRRCNHVALVLIPIALWLGDSLVGPVIAERRVSAEHRSSTAQGPAGGSGQRTGRGTSGLSPQDRQKVEEAIKGLPSSQQEQIKQQIEKLTPAQRGELAEAVKSLSPAEQKALVERASQELDKYQPPHDQHVIEGPGVPATQLFDYINLSRGASSNAGIGQNEPQLLVAGRELAQNLVLFRRRGSDAYTDRGIGNGVLISKSLVLTARHVAEEVKANPNKYALIQLGRRTGAFLIPLAFVATIDVSAAAGAGDPDIALVKVVGAVPMTAPTLADGANVLKQEIASIGSSELEGLLPSMGTGIITTSLKTRELDRALAIKRTVVGSSIRSFPGLSGAPVFRGDGTIVAVILGGVKKYAPTGETVTRIPPGTDWETFPYWTWATPVGSLLNHIRAEVQKDR
jgi:hypothetical protein